MSRRSSKSRIPNNRINSNDPKDLDRRIFVANIPTNRMTHKAFEERFTKYGKITAISMLQGYGFVQYEREEEADAAVKAEHGRYFDGYKMDINKAAERRKMNKGRSRSSPPRRGALGFQDGQESRRDRSPLRSSPRRGSRERESRSVRDAREPRVIGDPRDLRNPRERDVRELRDDNDRDFRDARDIRDARDPRDYRDPRDSRDLRDRDRDLRDRDVRDARDVRDPLFERFKDIRDPGDPLYRVDAALDKYRLDDLYRKKDELQDRYRDPLERFPEDRVKREERRREELYRQYFDEIQRRVDAERAGAIDCSVVALNKQSKEYAETVGRKVRDLGMMVDLIFLNTEVSLTQALEDVSRGGSPFAIVITQQHETHRSCTVNILFGTPQEHRNMPLADAMMLVERSYDRYKTEVRDKEREDIARQAAKLSAEAILKERVGQEEGARGSNPPGIMTLLGLLAENRYISAEEIDKVILYLQQRKERLLAISGDSLASHLSRQAGASSTLNSQSALGQSTLSSSQKLQHAQQLTPAAPGTQTANSQQELQAKILSLFNSGASSAANTPGSAPPPAAPNQSYGSMSNPLQRSGPQSDTGILGPIQQRSQPAMNQLPTLAQVSAVRASGPRPGINPQMQNPQMQYMYSQLPNRLQSPGGVPGQRPGAPSGINFDNPSVQKALDTLIQSGPTLSHLVGQAAAPNVRSLMPQQSSLPVFPRHL